MHMYFFLARTKYVRACACTELHRSELFLPCFQNFFFVSSVYSVPSQLLASSSRELSSFAVCEACCSQKLPGLSLLLTSSPLSKQEPSTCAPVRTQSCTDQNFFFRAFRTFSSCLLCIPCPRSCSRAVASSPLSLCAKPAACRNYQR